MAEDQEFSLSGELIQQKGNISHFSVAFSNGGFDIVMDIKSLSVYTIEVDNSAFADECFKALTKTEYDDIYRIFNLSIDSTKEEFEVLESKVKEWLENFPGDEWHSLSDRYDINAWSDDSRNYISVYKNHIVNGEITTDTSKWWTIFDEEIK